MRPRPVEKRSAIDDPSNPGLFSTPLAAGPITLTALHALRLPLGEKSGRAFIGVPPIRRVGISEMWLAPSQ
jgi:hypothetical protein